MSIWVPGAGGRLGTCVAAALEAAGRPWRGTTRAEVDITDYPGVEAYVESLGPAAIINCAAYTDVDRAEGEPTLAHQINVGGARNLARVSEARGIRLIHFSTDYIFDGDSREPYPEEAPVRPLGVYGQTKWEGERAVLEVHPEALVVRSSWLFGPAGGDFVARMGELMASGAEVRVVVDRTGRPTYGPDLAAAILRLLELNPVPGGPIHFANHGPVSWYEFALAIRARLGASCGVVPIPAQEYGSRAARPSYSVLDTGRYEELTGNMPRPWSEALGELLQAGSEGISQ